MRAAFAVWDERIAPVFDVAQHLHVVDAESGRIVAAREEGLAEESAAGKARRLSELGVGTLVCGAISRSVQDMVATFGIDVVPFVAGDLRQVVDAWVSGRLDGSVYAMPGCGRRERRRRRLRRSRRTP